jgi:hypothetical protein
MVKQRGRPRKNLQQVASEFKESMQQIANDGDMTISIEFQGESHLIAEPDHKQSNPKTMAQKKQTKEFLRYSFTHEELFDKGADLARLSSEIVRIKSEAKAIAQEFKAKIEQKNSEIGTLGEHINNGYEHRYIECEVHLNDPNSGKKTTYRKDTGESVRVDNMTAEELQLEIEYEAVSDYPPQQD